MYRTKKYYMYSIRTCMTLAQEGVETVSDTYTHIHISIYIYIYKSYGVKSTKVRINNTLIIS